MGDIILARPGGEAFKFLDYGIYVDGKKINVIRDDTRKVLKLKEGQHEIYVKMLGAKSNTLNIKVKKRESVRLSCGMRLTGAKIIFAGFYLFSKKLLKLDYMEL